MGAAKRDAGIIYLEGMRSRFDGSANWDELAASTQEQRRAHGYGPDDPILIQSRDLLKSLVPGDPSNILTVLPDGVDAGTSLPKAAPLHFGAPSKNLPARPILIDPDPRTDAAITERLAEGIREATK